MLALHDVIDPTVKQCQGPACTEEAEHELAGPNSKNY